MVLCNGELQNLYENADRAGHVARMKDGRWAQKLLLRILEKCPPHRPNIGSTDNIICDLKEVGYESDLKAFAKWRAYILIGTKFGFYNTNDSVLCVCV